MTTERDPRTRIVLSWLREDAHENAERVLLRALDEVDATPQRRSLGGRRGGRTDMNSYAEAIVAAAAVLVIAVVGYQFLPGNGGVGSQPTIAPSPSPTLLARASSGSRSCGRADATGHGSDVTGTMTVSNEEMSLTVDLECALTAEDGIVGRQRALEIDGEGHLFVRHRHRPRPRQSLVQSHRARPHAFGFNRKVPDASSAGLGDGAIVGWLPTPPLPGRNR